MPGCSVGGAPALFPLVDQIKSLMKQSSLPDQVLSVHKSNLEYFVKTGWFPSSSLLTTKCSTERELLILLSRRHRAQDCIHYWNDKIYYHENLLKNWKGPL